MLVLFNGFRLLGMEFKPWMQKQILKAKTVVAFLANGLVFAHDSVYGAA